MVPEGRFNQNAVVLSEDAEGIVSAGATEDRGGTSNSGAVNGMGGTSSSISSNAGNVTNSSGAHNDEQVQGCNREISNLCSLHSKCHSGWVCHEDSPKESDSHCLVQVRPLQKIILFSPHWCLS